MIDPIKAEGMAVDTRLKEEIRNTIQEELDEVRKRLELASRDYYMSRNELREYLEKELEVSLQI